MKSAPIETDKRKCRSEEKATGPRNKPVQHDCEGSVKVHWIPKRYVMTILACNCVMWSFALRYNLSVAIVAMVTSSTMNKTRVAECPGAGNATLSVDQVGDFQWGSELQGIVLGSAYYGYLVTQILGGRLAERFGARRVMGYALAAMSLVGLLTETGARVSVYLLIVIKVLQGLAAGIISPTVPVIMTKWAPVPERARINAFIISGSTVGVVLSRLLAGVLSRSEWLGGWPSVFYITGLLGFLSAVLWLALITDCPSQHSSISREEREYITRNLPAIESRKVVPWRGILMSWQTWTIYITFFATAWGMYTFGDMLPTYIEQVSDFNLTENGVFSAIPFVLMCVVTNAGGVLSDVILRRCRLKTVTARKLMTGLGGMSLAAFTVAAGYTGCDVTLGIVLLTLALGLSGLVFVGLYVNPLDVAQHYAGTVIGIANTISTIPGFVAPYVAGYIIGDEPTLAKWRTVFLISGGICSSGTLLFLLFASAEVQPWALELDIEDSPAEPQKGTGNPEYLAEQTPKIRQPGANPL